MIDIRKELLRRFENRNKKGFIIEVDDYLALPSKQGFTPPSNDILIDAIEKYCRENHYELKFIRLSDPIIFMLDGDETYEAYPELYNVGRFANGYVLHCVEFK